MTDSPRRGRGPAPRPADPEILAPVAHARDALLHAEDLYRRAIRRARSQGATIAHLTAVTGLSKPTIIDWTKPPATTDEQTAGMIAYGISGPVRDATGLDTRNCGIPEE